MINNFLQFSTDFPECVAKGSRLTWESEGSESEPYGPAVGESSKKGLFMDVSRVSLRRYSIVICIKVVCHARKVMRLAAQAQGFVKVRRLRRSHIGNCSFRVVF